jgi:hypothetical protein
VKTVMPRFEDRRKCDRCQGLVERWCSEDPITGDHVNLPTLLPTVWFEGRGHGRVSRLDPIDVVTTTIDVANSKFSTTQEVRQVRIDYYCPRCEVDVLTSNTSPWRGELPEEAFYEAHESA